MKNIIFILLLQLVSYTAFGQLNLSQEECREMALKNNEDLKKAGNALEQARLDKAVAFTSYLPDVSGSVMDLYNPEDIDAMGYKLQMRGTYMAGISLTEPLYAGGKINAANKLAQIGTESSQEMQRKTRMEVISDADNAYWTYVAVNEKVKMLESYKKQLDALYQQTGNRVKVEMATQNDLLRIDAKRSQIQYQLQKARNGYKLCELSLCNVMGIDLDTKIVATDTMITVSSPSKLENDISKRPELKLLEKQVEADQQQINMTRADFLPTVALSAQYSYFGGLKLKGTATDGSGNQVPFTTTYDKGGSMLMASVKIPVFHWGEGRKKVRKAKIEMENSQLDLQKNRRLLSIQLEQAIQNVTDSYNMVKTADIGMRQANENLRVMKNRYQNAMCTLTDLMDANTQWQEAHSSLIEAKTQYKIYQTEYLRASGRL